MQANARTQGSAAIREFLDDSAEQEARRTKAEQETARVEALLFPLHEMPESDIYRVMTGDLHESREVLITRSRANALAAANQEIPDCFECDSVWVLGFDLKGEDFAFDERVARPGARLFTRS
jgi:hypothetical protein